MMREVSRKFGRFRLRRSNSIFFNYGWFYEFVTITQCGDFRSKLTASNDVLSDCVKISKANSSKTSSFLLLKSTSNFEVGNFEPHMAAFLYENCQKCIKTVLTSQWNVLRKLRPFWKGRFFKFQSRAENLNFLKIHVDDISSMPSTSPHRVMTVTWHPQSATIQVFINGNIHILPIIL